MAGGISLSSVLTTWQDIGNMVTAFKLVAATLKIYQDVWAMCTNAKMLKTSGYIGDVSFRFLTVSRSAGLALVGCIFISSLKFVSINYLSRPLHLLETWPFLPCLPISTRQCHVSQSKSSSSWSQTMSPPLPESLPHNKSLPPTSHPLLFQNWHRGCRSCQS